MGRGGRSVAGRMGKAGSAGERRAGPGPVSTAPASGTARRSLCLPRAARRTPPPSGHHSGAAAPSALSPRTPAVPRREGGAPGGGGEGDSMTRMKLGVCTAWGSERGFGFRLGVRSPPGAEQTPGFPGKSLPDRARGPFTAGQPFTEHLSIARPRQPDWRVPSRLTTGIR